MFRQEINLYRDFEDPTPPETLLSWRQMWICNLVMTFIFILFSIYLLIATEIMSRKKVTMQNLAAETKNQFFTLKSKFPQAFFNQDVAQSIEQLTNQMKVRQQILEKIANNALFSDNLEAFARIIIPDVWLTDIIIADAGDSISLKGKSRSPERMQEFLAKLTEDKLFKEYSLSVNNIIDNTQTTASGDLEFDIKLTKTAT